jgi:hypothetical protein
MCIRLTVGFCLKIYISLILDPHHRITKQRYQPLDPCSDHSHPSTGRHGHVAGAFALVERCPDFSSLASLCRKEAAYPPDDNPRALWIQVHSDRFKDEFAVELYRWYVQHSLLHYCLPFNGSRLKMSLGVVWINSLSLTHGAAATVLLLDAEQATNPVCFLGDSNSLL